MRAFLILILSCVFVVAETITITQKESGKSIQVSLVYADDKEVSFLKNNKEFTVKLSTLTAESVELITSKVKYPTIAGMELKGRKIVYLIDSSRTFAMEKKGEISRKLVSDSVQELSGFHNYSLLFFGGVIWTVGDEVIRLDPDSKRIAPKLTVKSKNEKVTNWERILKISDPAYARRSHEPREKLEFEWLKATPNEVKNTLKYIEAAPYIIGDSGVLHFDAAVAMKPDEIVYITDGLIGASGLVHTYFSDKANEINCKVNVIVFGTNNLFSLNDLVKSTNGKGVMISEDGKEIKQLK